MDLCLRKTRLGKSRDYRDVIVFEKLQFQNISRPPHENEELTFPNSTSLKSVFEQLRGGLEWTVGLSGVFILFRRSVDGVTIRFSWQPL